MYLLPQLDEAARLIRRAPLEPVRHAEYPYFGCNLETGPFVEGHVFGPVGFEVSGIPSLADVLTAHGEHARANNLPL